MADKPKAVKYTVDAEYIDETTFPEKSLIVAIISRALLDASGHITAGGKEYKRLALYWLHSNYPNKAFSFSWCCSMLNLEPNTVRKVLKNKTPSLRNRTPESYLRKEKRRNTNIE